LKITQGYCPHCQKQVFTERDWDVALIIISFCCGILPGVICLLINLSKPENKCTICGSITTAGPTPQPQVQIDLQQNVSVERAAPKVPSAGTNQPMEFCPNCGSKLEGANNFCELCGEDLKKYK
jgi:hypothetical protein